MDSIADKTIILRVFQCVAIVGVAVAGISACATPGTSADSYELVLNAPGLVSVQPKVVVIHDDYSQTVERSTWKARHGTWPQADLIFWRIKDNFRGQQTYVYEESLPELIRALLPGESIILDADGSSNNSLGTLDYQRFRRGQVSECVFIRQGIDRFSDQVEVIGSGEPLGDMVIRGWYCVDLDEQNKDAVFQEFIAGIGILGWSVPARKFARGDAYPYVVKFTSTVHETSDALEVTENLNEIPIDFGRVYVYVQWRGLTLESHLAELRAFDGEGNQVETSSYEFTPTTSNWSTWWPHDIDPLADQRGTWRFEIDLDGETVVRETLLVGRTRYGWARSGTTLWSGRAAVRQYHKTDEAFEYKVFAQNGYGAWAWTVRETFIYAKTEALWHCEKRSAEYDQPGECRIYAAGDDVVWSMSEKDREDIIEAYSE